MSKVDMSIIGKTFGKLTVLEFSYIKNKVSYWKCKCECGNEKIVSRGSLTSKDVISCGCYRKEHIHDFGKTHGMSNTKLYKVWSGIMQRTCNPKSYNYYRYGGRGITICEEWKDFSVFNEWAIKNGYNDTLTIDRINNNGNYEPNNCRWVTMKEQANNKRTNKLTTYHGETHTTSEWSRIIGINVETLRYRLFVAEWDVDKALNYYAKELICYEG